MNPYRETRGTTADPRRRLLTCGRPGVVPLCPCRKCASGAMAEAYQQHKARLAIRQTREERPEV